ncbi:MAG: MFS transporter [Candidatus Zixiibacteriota bacterium]
MRKIIVDYLIDLKLITRNIHLFLLGGLFMGLLAASMQLLMNLYLKDMGYGESFIGRTLSISAIGAVFAALPAAYMAARYHIKPILIVSTLLMAVTFFVMGHTGSEMILLAAALGFGFSSTIRSVISAPFIMRNSSERERMLVFTANYSLWMVAAIIGSYLGGWLHEYFRDYFSLQMSAGEAEIQAYRYAMVVTSGIGLLAVVPFLFIKAKAPDREELKRAFSYTALKANWRLLFKLNLPYMLLGAGAGLIIPFLNLYFRERFSLNATQIGAYFSILSVVMLCAVMLVPVLKKRLGFINTVVLTELLSIPFMLILCLTNDLSMAFWAFLFRGALMNMGSPVTTSFMMEAVPAELHGIVNSFSSMSWTVSSAISTQIGGAIIEKSGFETSFYWAIGLYLASAFSFYYYFSKCEIRSGDSIKIDRSAIR